MNIFYSKEAQEAFNAAPKEVKVSANYLLAEYSRYANRHSLPGKGTLSRISQCAREVLELPKGTRVFMRGKT